MENLIITVLLSITYLIIFAVGVKTALKIHKLSGNKKALMLVIFSLCCYLSGNAQTNNYEMIAGNFTNNVSAIPNPAIVNYEPSGTVTPPPPVIKNQVVQIDENNSIIIQIEKDNSKGDKVTTVNIVAYGVITQKLTFKGDSMSCADFPGLVKTVHTPKIIHNRCE